MFKNMKLLNKFILTFSILIFFTAIVLIWSNITLNSTIQSFTDFYDHPYTASNAVRDINTAIESIQYRVQTIKQNPGYTAQSKKDIEKSNKIIRDSIGVLKQYYLGDMQDVKLLEEEFKAWSGVNADYITALEKNQTNITETYEEQNETFTGAMANQLDNMNDTARAKGYVFYSQAIEYGRQSSLYAIIIAVLVLGVSTLLAILLTRDTHNPIQTLITAIQKIRQGEKDISVPVNRKDELGQLSAAFLDMAEYFKTKSELDTLLLRLENEMSREQLRITLQSIGDAALSTDTHGRIMMMNPVAEGLTGWSFEEAKGVHVSEVLHIINEKTRITCECPIEKVLATGKVVGLANHTVLISRDGREIPIADSAAPVKDESGAVHGVVLIFRDVTEEKKSQEAILHLSFHDSLTGLYNRRYFEESTKKLDVPQNLPISVIMGDVNGLKLINDALGHHSGDKVLSTVAEIIKKVCRPDDIVTRWGGDEFIIMLPKTSSKDVAKIAERVRKAVSDITINGMNISISLGFDTKRFTDEPLIGIEKKAEDLMYRNKLLETSSMRGNAIHTILNTLHEKNPREKQHSERVGMLCRQIGEALNMREDETRKLEVIGLMHDIGKIAIDENILNKTGKLTPEDWEDIRRHPDIGYRILSASKEMSDIADYILAHHERLDGSGYPKGISSEKIPLQSRILAIADSFDAMTSDRPYRKALSNEVAAEELMRNAGTQFDPEIVRVFVERVLNLPLLAQV